MRRPAILLALLVSGCSHLLPPAGDEIVRARVVPARPEVARERVTERLARDGFTIKRTDDPFLTTSAEEPAPNPAWVRCDRVLAYDPNPNTSTRSSFQAAEGTRVVVVAQFGTISGKTDVSLDPSFIGQYRNPYTNTGFESRCASTGVLERELLDAASD